MTLDKRASTRKEVERPARLFPSDNPLGSVITGSVMDISNGGMSLMVPMDLKTGTRYTARFDIPFNGTNRSVSVVGIVIYSIHVHDNVYRAGIQFSELDLSSTEVIDDFID